MLQLTQARSPALALTSLTQTIIACDPRALDVKRAIGALYFLGVAQYRASGANRMYTGRPAYLETVRKRSRNEEIFHQKSLRIPLDIYFVRPPVVFLLFFFFIVSQLFFRICCYNCVSAANVALFELRFVFSECVMTNAFYP
ncbi:hypothetical protein Y032_0608g596 [Ancylostoma ceylanicum]|uniref:Uncharacterized protein n=1 Tax=Ancylostoma ceylanicum TaxID=53326 RepID=A0A016WMP2_9BILA|nr:hypothetical protein Y032_0608g596 [Ancylostoma ceylanicum]